MNHQQRDYLIEDLNTSFDDIKSIESLKNKVIFVSGACGFMGSWLLESILFLNSTYDFNIKVYATAKEIEKYKLKFPHLFINNVECISLNIKNYLEIPEDVNYVLNLAGIPDIRVHSSDPIKVVDATLRGVENMLSASSRLPNLEKFIHMSSGLIYGQVDNKLIEEDNVGTLPTLSSSMSYTESKRMAEVICQVYRSQMRIPTIIFRPFTFIGPYQSMEMPWAINSFIREAFGGGPIRILGNIHTKRSCMYPSDMVYAILKGIVDGENGECFNLGSEDYKTILEISEIVSGCFPNRVQIEYPRVDYVEESYFVPSMKKMKLKFGFETKFDSTTSIKKTIEWFKLGN